MEADDLMSTNPYAQFRVDPSAPEEEEEKDVNPYQQFREEEQLLDPGLNPNDPRSYVVQAVREAPGDIKRIGQGFVDMVTNPIDTIRGLGTVVKGAAETVAGTGYPTGAGGEAIRSVSEDVQGVIDDPVGTVVRNPVSTLGTAAGLPGLKYIDPLADAGRVAQRTARNFARNETRKTLGLPRVDPDIDIKGVVDTALKERVDMTPAGFERLYGRLEGPTGKRTGGVMQRIEGDMNEMIKQADERGELISLPSIDKHLDGLQSSLRGTEGGAEAIAEIQKLRGSLFNEFGNRLMIKPSELQHYKINIGKQVYEAKSDIARRFDTQTKVMDKRREAAKEQVERVAPEMKELNQQWADLAKLEPWMAKGINRLQDMEPGFQRMVAGILQNPQARAKIAQWVDRINRGNASGIEKALNSREIRAAMILAGQGDINELGEL